MLERHYIKSYYCFRGSAYFPQRTQDLVEINNVEVRPSWNTRVDNLKISKLSAENRSICF